MNFKEYIALLAVVLFIVILENQPQLLDRIADLLWRVASALHKVVMS